MELTATNVNQAVNEGFHYLAVAGVEENSRNGITICAPEPVLTTYTHPTERVLFSPLRDANPFLHVFEALGFLAGESRLEWYAYFAKNIRNYSDDGKTLWGNYGVRWRLWFGYDQIQLVVKELKKNPDSRRCVLVMWDAKNADMDGRSYEAGTEEVADLFKAMKGGKDIPCNTHIYFDLRGGALNMTVMQRSGDALWGVYGANAVHMSILQEYVAAGVGAPVGVYRQFCNNFHVYASELYKVCPERVVHSEKEMYGEALRELAVDADIHDAYKTGEVTPFPLVNTDIETWDSDLKRFMENPLSVGYQDKFFSTVAQPMYIAWKQRKDRKETGVEWAKQIAAPDWRKACVEWIERRERK